MMEEGSWSNNEILKKAYGEHARNFRLASLSALPLATDTAVVNADPGATNKSDIFHELRRQ